MKFKIYTLGCKLNFAESSAIARRIEEQGYTRASRGQAANLVIINSCAVTGESERKARELIRRTVRENPDAELIVTGCYAKLRSDEILAIPGVTRVETVKELTSYSLAERTRSFLKVQDGCDYHCTYCTVWRARGESRNAPIAQIVDQAHQIAATGIKEIVLTGVNIGDFGRSTGETLLDLIRSLDTVPGIERYRISSIEPNLLTSEIIAFCASSEKFMPHFHIPLQSGSDPILRAMGRRYRTSDFEAKISEIRSAMPNSFIGIDVIVGFPGETDENFLETHSLLQRIAPSFLHIFPYSPRPNTPAANLPSQIPPHTKKLRAATLKSLSDSLLQSFTTTQLKYPQKILVEGTTKQGLLFGHTENYIRLEIPGLPNLINTTIPYKH